MIRESHGNTARLCGVCAGGCVVSVSHPRAAGGGIVQTLEAVNGGVKVAVGFEPLPEVVACLRLAAHRLLRTRNLLAARLRSSQCAPPPRARPFT